MTLEEEYELRLEIFAALTDLVVTGAGPFPVPNSTSSRSREFGDH
ncbi:hypothetical protein [Nocardia cyriacigeorgica]|nr:hypothetical protein [Nocardia cyriacigeorgica]